MACLLITAAAGQVEKAVRSFSTLTDDRLALSDWLRDAGCTHVALESTRTSWRPIHNRLEGQFEVLMANAYPSQQVPGRKPDVKDAAWLADRLRHGLLRGSFSPPAEQRRLRDLTRYRTPLVEERARLTNRLQAARADANVKLSSVVTDSRGVSARAIRAALIGGETDPAVLAALARGRLGAKRDLLAQAVVGRFTAHHACLVTAHRSHLDYLEEALERGSAAIEERRRDEQEAIRLLESGPGISQRTAEISGAEIGPDLRRFPSAQPLASWAGMCPGNGESGGKRLSGRTPKGNQWLPQVLIEIAHVASKTRDTQLAAQDRRIAARRGTKPALVARGHTSLVIIYHILTRRLPYQDLGPTYFDQLDRQHLARRLVRRLKRLGDSVSLQPQPSPPHAA